MSKKTKIQPTCRARRAVRIKIASAPAASDVIATPAPAAPAVEPPASAPRGQFGNGDPGWCE
jgi:hypothetical protein